MFSDVMLRHKIWFIACFQAILVFGSLVFAWLLRFDFTLPNRDLLFAAAPLLILIRLGMLSLFNLHRGWWTFSGVSEAISVLKAVCLGTIAFYLLMRGLGIDSFPRSIYLLEAILAAGLLACGRLLTRVLAEILRRDSKPTKDVILIGAGFAAQMVIREICRPGSDYRVIGCVDDDSSKLGIRVQGIPVLGCVQDLPKLLACHPVTEVLIAAPSATGEQMQRFLEVCRGAKAKFRTVPALREIIRGDIGITQFREVNLEDLLGREQIEMDLDCVREELCGHVVLVTGAAGSIGSELCRQIQAYGPGRLVCVDQSETGIFYLQQELSRGTKGDQAQFYVADIGDTDRMNGIFKEYAPQVVFHAAAYKHVPVMERNVYEAVRNNVFGLLGLLEIAEKNGCQNFVMISSDKAVNPTNVMGATKRVGELILACRESRSMRCVSVRFGNVLGSSGSVVPVLQSQMANNQPLTITHPEIRRFFMTCREAVSLVLQAFAIGQHGEILVLDMGEPISILQLAKTLIHLSGKSEEQVSIRFTGLREGEKLCEELFLATEKVHSTVRPKIWSARSSNCMPWPDLTRHLKELRISMTVNGVAPIRAKLHEIVPEYATPEALHPGGAKQVTPELLAQSVGQS